MAVVGHTSRNTTTPVESAVNINVGVMCSSVWVEGGAAGYNVEMSAHWDPDGSAKRVAARDPEMWLRA